MAHRSHFKAWKPIYTTAIHSAYYFQIRQFTPDEYMLSSQKRRQPLCNDITGKDVHSLTANTTILQTDGAPMMYLFVNAHCSTHGSLDANDVPHVN